MIRGSLAVYYVTKYQEQLWTELKEKNEAVQWQNNHANPDYSEATNPHANYCRTHGLALDTRIPAISDEEFRKTFNTSTALEPLKHLIGNIELFVRCFLSLGTCFSTYACKILPLGRLCPNRLSIILSDFASKLQSPKKNLIYLIKSIFSSIFYTVCAPIAFYVHRDIKTIKDNINHFALDFTKEAARLDGTPITLGSFN